MVYAFTPIGYIHSPFKEKFGIPRQSSLALAAQGELVLCSPYNHADSVRGLEGFSHLWLQFVFHQTLARGWTPLVRPPRLGGNAKVGVFASRSTHRPNPIGLSLVELIGIEYTPRLTLKLAGIDLLDQTPILDIKPYLPFVEAQPQAQSGFVSGPPAELAVNWNPCALKQADSLRHLPTHWRALLEQLLAQDPRPAYQDDPDRCYGVRLFDLDVHFKIQQDQVEILEIKQLGQN